MDVNVEGTLDTGSWDGHCGGIVVVRANGTFSVGGQIIATGKGFRGAPTYDSPADYRPGYVGESELIGYQSDCLFVKRLVLEVEEERETDREGVMEGHTSQLVLLRIEEAVI